MADSFDDSNENADINSDNNDFMIDQLVTGRPHRHINTYDHSKEYRNSMPYKDIVCISSG